MQRAIDEADIRRRIDKLVNAIRIMDLEGVMSIYAPDIVSFDLEAPLRYVGAATKRKHWAGAFAAHRPPLGYEIRDLAVTAGDDVAFGHSLNRVSGTLKNGRRNGFWLRCRSISRAAARCLISRRESCVPARAGA